MRDYEYRVESHAALAPTLKKYYFHPLVSRLPLWLHANTLTATSGVLSIFAFGTLLFIAVMNGFDFLLVLAALMWWSRDTLDNLDGGQARRTGTSGPMGELMDHSIDAYTVYPVVLGVCLAFGCAPVLALITLSVCLLGFWAAMWELRHRGVFFTGVLSETEGAFILALLLLGGGLFGRAALTAHIGGLGISVFGFVVGLTIFGFGYQLITSMQRVPDNKLRSEVIPLVLMQAALVLWFWRADGAVSMLAIGLLICLASGRTIVMNVESRLFGNEFRSVCPSTVIVFAVACGFALLGPTWGIAQELICYALVGGLTLDGLARLYYDTTVIRRVTGRRVFHISGDFAGPETS